MFAKILCLALLGFALIQIGSSQRGPPRWQRTYPGAPHYRPASWQGPYVGPSPYYPPHPVHPVHTVEENTVVLTGFFTPLMDLLTEILRLFREFLRWITGGYIDWVGDANYPYRQPPIVVNRLG